jgi:DNA-binding FadR family transcriptional regulator
MGRASASSRSAANRARTLPRSRTAGAAPHREKAGGRPFWGDIRLARAGRLYQQIASQVERLIRENGARPGQRLPPERELARQLGVSRPSLREAMIALETSGLIEVRIGDGTYVRGGVRHPSRPGWAKGHDAVPGLLEQLEARKLVEPHLAALAAKTITDAEIDALEVAVERAAAKFAAGGQAEDEDYFFHVKLAESSRNWLLAGLVRHLWDLRRGKQAAMWNTFRRRVARREHRLKAADERRAIIAALRRRDAGAARSAMQRILKAMEQRLLGAE